MLRRRGRDVGNATASSQHRRWRSGSIAISSPHDLWSNLPSKVKQSNAQVATAPTGAPRAHAEQTRQWEAEQEHRLKQQSNGNNTSGITSSPSHDRSTSACNLELHSLADDEHERILAMRARRATLAMRNRDYTAAELLVRVVETQVTEEGTAPLGATERAGQRQRPPPPLPPPPPPLGLPTVAMPEAKETGYLSHPSLVNPASQTASQALSTSTRQSGAWQWSNPAAETKSNTGTFSGAVARAGSDTRITGNAGAGAGAGACSDTHTDACSAGDAPTSEPLMARRGGWPRLRQHKPSVPGISSERSSQHLISDSHHAVSDHNPHLDHSFGRAPHSSRARAGKSAGAAVKARIRPAPHPRQAHMRKIPTSSAGADHVLRVLVDIGSAAFTVHVHDASLPKSFILCEALRRYALTHHGAHPNADALYSQWRCELADLSHEIGYDVTDGERFSAVLAADIPPVTTQPIICPLPRDLQHGHLRQREQQRMEICAQQ